MGSGVGRWVSADNIPPNTPRSVLASFSPGFVGLICTRPWTARMREDVSCSLPVEGSSHTWTVNPKDTP